MHRSVKFVDASRVVCRWAAVDKEVRKWREVSMKTEIYISCDVEANSQIPG